jgi:PAS domain S-box-containing protein
MTIGNDVTVKRLGVFESADTTARGQAEETLLKAGALQRAIFNSANFSSIATDASGVIQIFNVGAERMLGYTAAEVVNKITPADISDPQEVVARAEALSLELGTPITPGFEALVFKASRGIEDIYELTYFRKDGSRFPAVVSVTALRDAQDVIIGYLLIGTDNTARKHAEEALLKAGALQSAIFNSANFSSIATDAKGVIQIFNVGAERMLGYAAADVMNKITPADISDPQEVIARAEALSVELGTPITPGFEALVFKASRGIEDIYELTYIRKDGSRFPAVVSVTALRDAQDAIIGYLLIGTDNTARKEAEEALLKAGALQSAIFNSANFSSIATDAKGVIQIFNVGAERMLGYTAAEVMNKITPADISDPQEVIVRAEALSTELGTPITPGFEALVFKASRGIEDIYELTYFRKDGSRFPAVVSVTALRDAQDAIIGYLLIGTDNTARKEAEEALLKAGALQSAIFNSANFSSIATDAKGVIQIFNVGAERMLGYTAAEVMNQITPADISDPQELIARAKALSVELGTPITPGFEALVFKASRGIEDIYELTYIRKDGSRFPAVVSVTALRDAQDAIIGYLLIGTEIKAGALQSAIFNSANFSSIATDAKGVIQIFNVGAERMLGYAAADVMNKITPADISDPQEVIARAEVLSAELGTSITPGFEALVFKASRGIEDIYELTYIRKDGSRFPAVVSVTALRDAQDAIIGYLLIGTDNTARKLVEAEQKKLDQRLRDQTALLSEANEEIQRFVYIVSHDLRSPLVNIMGFASELDAWRKQIFERLKSLRAQVGGEQDGESDGALRSDFEEALSFIKSSVAKMDRLIGALLKLSREGQREFLPQSIDMSQLLQSTLEALAHQARDVNAKISIGELPAITSDRLALEQVFSNLMDNAVKYLRADVPGSIEVRATESDGAITYEVCDNGRGIDVKDRDRIFDLFRRSGIQDRPGDGIGLAHARTLVRRLGGSINVESEPDRGTVFKVTLPKRWHLPISEIAA